MKVISMLALVGVALALTGCVALRGIASAPLPRTGINVTLYTYRW